MVGRAHENEEQARNTLMYTNVCQSIMVAAIVDKQLVVELLLLLRWEPSPRPSLRGGRASPSEARRDGRALGSETGCLPAAPPVGPAAFFGCLGIQV
mmetsp:Transcript_3491/g.8251  ORF Transcript_3491/g.8251 Transcript_3491/m.8251 type:complete len:97 (+) Transcript_3491:1691-1981(+)